MQEDKIKLYEELLEADPGSRLFLPLARLYLERGEPEKAISTLETGLNRYQEHFEARLLLHETLREQGRPEEAREHLRMVSEVLRKYPLFWEHWADTLESEGQIDATVGVRFLARYFQGREPGWGEVLRRGMLYSQGKEDPPDTEYSPETEDPPETENPSKTEDPPEAEGETVSPESLEPEEGTVLSDEEGRDPYRTKTMADILVSQGDYAQALDIYTELAAEVMSPEERDKLQKRINWVKEQIEANTGNNQGSESDSEPEPEPEPESEPEQAPEPEQEQEATSEPALDSEPEPELELIPEPDPEFDSDSGTEPEPEAESGPEAELDTEEEPEPEPEPEEAPESEEAKSSSSSAEAELVQRLERLAERLETRQ